MSDSTRSFEWREDSLEEGKFIDSFFCVLFTDRLIHKGSIAIVSNFSFQNFNRCSQNEIFTTRFAYF